MNAGMNTGSVAFKTGVVCAVDAAKVRVRVKFAELDGLTSAWLPIGQGSTKLNKHYVMMDIGEHVACLMDANLEDGVVLCAIYSSADLPPVQNADKTHIQFSDNSYAEYDRAAHVMTIAIGDCTFTLGATGLQVLNGDVKADDISLKAHKHPGIVPGPANTGASVA